MRRQVLGLVDQNEQLGQRAAADVGHGLDLDPAAVEEVVDLVAHRFQRRIDEELQVVVDRLHPALELLFLAAGQVADVAAERDDRARHECALVDAALGDLFEARGERQQRLSRTGLADQGDELQVGIHEQLDREVLAHVQRRQLPRARVVVAQRNELTVHVVVAGQGGLLGVLHAADQDELVGHEALGSVGVALAVEAVDHALVDVVLTVAAVEVVEVDLGVAGVVDRLDAERGRLDARVQVLGDEDDVGAGAGLQVQPGGDDPVVRDLRIHVRGQVAHEAGHEDAEAAAVLEFDAVGEGAVLAQVVEDPDGPARGPAEFVGLGLEAVELLEHVDRDDDLAVGEGVDGVGFVEQDVGVDQIDACGLGHRCGVLLPSWTARHGEIRAIAGKLRPPRGPEQAESGPSGSPEPSGPRGAQKNLHVLQEFMCRASRPALE